VQAVRSLRSPDTQTASRFARPLLQALSGGSRIVNDSEIGFCVIYRWQVAGADEEQFLEAWKNVTKDFRMGSNGLGSRIHLSEDGVWLAYAQWPSRAAWESAKLETAEGLEAMSVMSDAIIERLEPILLEPIADLLVLPIDGT